VVFLNSCLKVVFSVFFKRKTILNVPGFCHANSFLPPLALPPTKKSKGSRGLSSSFGKKHGWTQGCKELPVPLAWKGGDNHILPLSFNKHKHKERTRPFGNCVLSN
jgi:hypothetical protein